MLLGSGVAVTLFMLGSCYYFLLMMYAIRPMSAIDSSSMDSASISIGIFCGFSVMLVIVVVTCFVSVCVSFRVLVNVIVGFCVMVSVSVLVFMVSTCWVTVVVWVVVSVFVTVLVVVVVSLTVMVRVIGLVVVVVGGVVVSVVGLTGLMYTSSPFSLYSDRSTSPRSLPYMLVRWACPSSGSLPWPHAM